MSSNVFGSLTEADLAQITPEYLDNAILMAFKKSMQGNLPGVGVADDVDLDSLVMPSGSVLSVTRWVEPTPVDRAKTWPF